MKKNNWYIVWLLMVLAVIAMGSCIKHLIIFKQWGPLGFMVVKDLTAVLTVAYVLTAGNKTSDQPQKKLASFAVVALLAVSAISDYAFNVARF
jgi:hypothetical protein